MSVAEHLHPEAVLLHPAVADKWALLGTMAAALVDAGTLPADLQEAAVHALEERERSVSTGMEQGIAVPHAALDGLAEMVVGMALLPDGIDFAALDGQPTTVVVMILVPKAEKLRHLQTLSEVARRLGDASFRERLLAVDTGAAALALWTEG